LVKAVTISSNKWPHLAGSGVLLRASVGRFGEEQALQRSDSGLLDAAGQEVAAMLNLTGSPYAGSVTRWGGGLPQYTVGHLDRVRTIRPVFAAPTPRSRPFPAELQSQRPAVRWRP
jgi:oxygen-dependent protoporphyrinogen oxidase